MGKANIFCAALLLSVAALQMHSVNASPMEWQTNRVHVQALSASSLIDHAAEFLEVRACMRCARMRRAL